METPVELLLNTLKELGGERKDGKDSELETFQWHLRRTVRPSIPRCDVENASRPKTVDVMVQTFGSAVEALKITEDILRKMGRNDLVQTLQLKAPFSTRPQNPTSTSDKDTLLNWVKEYQPENKNIKHMRILLCGVVDAGKSSFINSVSSVLRGRMVHGAHVCHTIHTYMPGSRGTMIELIDFTLKYQTYKIKKGNTQNFYPFVFSDTMGLEQCPGIREDDIKLALKGHMKDGYEFNPGKPMSHMDPLYNPHPTPEDKVHVLVLVIPANTVSVLPSALIEKIRGIRHAATELGIPLICILTKIDEICPLVNKDVKNVYKSKLLKEKMEEVSVTVGFPMNCIFPVKNYHEECDLSDDVDVLILKALKHMIHMAEDFVDNMYTDPMSE